MRVLLPRLFIWRRGETGLKPARAQAFDDGARALLLENALHALDGVALSIEQMAQSHHQLHVARPIIAPPARALHGFELLEAGFPETQHVRRQVETLRDLSNRAKSLFAFASHVHRSGDPRGGGRPQIMSYTPTTPHFKPKAPFGRVFAGAGLWTSRALAPKHSLSKFFYRRARAMDDWFHFPSKTPAVEHWSTPENAVGPRNWLYLVAALVFAMVIVGGATRLTELGLSITQWKPVTGVIPPLSAAEWAAAFEEYKKIRNLPNYSRIWTLKGSRSFTLGNGRIGCSGG